ncbi:hypothetical protein GGE50_004446 [Rhizobium leguminosarum]|nr:hypothetical protein [Rhizobium leguminosarum]MBY5486893.1 hypothetical protein [Rhizobium leguminosarum]MBY5500112.1 hypothetical protein [Rhizobium leguminosarum]MBY5507811.1 hypothetical protein [Rhizobium leguminosarum]MBY5513824.1 hypothetical protein [Rhizobium leguminosarum]
MAAFSWTVVASGGRSPGGLDGGRVDIEAEADSDAIPAIDDVDHHGELNLLLLHELGAEIFRSTTPAAGKIVMEIA